MNSRLGVTATTDMAVPARHREPARSGEAGGHAHLCGLATAIHEMSGLDTDRVLCSSRQITQSCRREQG
jgi:hypothetical protein